MIAWRDANLNKTSYALTEDASQKVVGSTSSTDKGFFLTQSPLKCSCTLIKLWEFVTYKKVRVVQFCLMCAGGYCTQNSNKESLNFFTTKHQTGEHL